MLSQDFLSFEPTMGNSQRKAKNRNSSLGQDALQILGPEWCPGSPAVSQQLLHDFKDHDDSFVSVESFTLEEGLQTASDTLISEHVSGQVESPEQLNFYNLHASFLSSFLHSTSMDCQTKVKQPLYDVVRSHLWSVHSPEYVTICASNILSILKIYGECVPEYSEVINKKSEMMFHILDRLHAHISQMKLGHEYPKGSLRCKSCHGCDSKIMLLKHVHLRNAVAKDNFCLICLEFLPQGTYLQHSMVAKHIKVKSRLIQNMYPYSCLNCRQRFTSKKGLDCHCESHVDSSSENRAHDSKVFEPVCCHLCQISFSDEASMKEHELKSLEHACRKEIAMELAQRVNYASDKLNISDGNFPPEITLRNHLLESASYNGQENVSIDTDVTNKLDGATAVTTTCGDRCEIIPQPAAPDSMYFCCPCGVNVPKANVINHENGQRHMQCCKAWVLQFQKAPQPFEKQKTNEGSVNLTIKSSCSTNPLNDRAVSSKTSSSLEKHSSTVEVTKDSVEMIPPFVEQGCSSVKEIKETDSPTALIVEKHCSFAEVSLETTNAMTSFAEKKVSNEAISLFTDEHIRQKMEEYLALEESVVRNAGLDGYYSCKQCVTVFSIYFPVMLSHVTGKRHLTSAQVQDQNTIDKKVQLLNYLVSIKSPKNKHLLSVVSSLSAKRVIQHSSVRVQNVASFSTEMKPTQTSIIESVAQNIDKDCSKSEISSPSQHNQFVNLIDLLSTSLPSKTNIVSQLGVLCDHKDLATSPKQTGAIGSLTEPSEIVPVEVIESQILKDRNNLLDGAAVLQDTIEVLRSTQDLQPDSTSPDALISEVEALVIGEETGITLHDQLLQACPGRDISDCETQCGTCGAFFQIYNGDLDLSLDMHVQNDPQHLLAIEMPTERDPQTMAESAKTVNVLLKCKPQKASVSSRKVSITDTSNGKSHVIAEVFSLEQNNIETREKIHYCKLCRVHVRNDTQFVHHLLLPQHLSEKWLRDLTDEDVHKKVMKLKSLLKYRYGGVALQMALQRISSLMAKQNRSLPEGSFTATSLSHQSSKLMASISSRVFVASNAGDGASIVSSSENISNMSRQSRLSSQMVASYVGISKRPHHFCKICQKTMDMNDKMHHERGRGHKANMLVQ